MMDLLIKLFWRQGPETPGSVGAVFGRRWLITRERVWSPLGFLHGCSVSRAYNRTTAESRTGLFNPPRACLVPDYTENLLSRARKNPRFGGLLVIVLCLAGL